MRAATFLAAARKLPFAPLERIVGAGGVVVVAPHPDDESLGCGGLVALARAQGRPARIVARARPREFVALLDEQPVRALLSVALHADEDEAAAPALALQRELQLAGVERRLRRRRSFRRPEAAVPELRRSAAIFTAEPAASSSPALTKMDIFRRATM